MRTFGFIDQKQLIIELENVVAVIPEPELKDWFFCQKLSYEIIFFMNLLSYCLFCCLFLNFCLFFVLILSMIVRLLKFCSACYLEVPIVISTKFVINLLYRMLLFNQIDATVNYYYQNGIYGIFPSFDMFPWICNKT